jgi:hypothetical protein
MKFENIISLCQGKNISVWKQISKNIIKFIDSENYTVIVLKEEGNEVYRFKC